MSKTDLIVCYTTLNAKAGHLRQLTQRWSDMQTEISRIEQDMGRTLKTEEEARFSYARRLQTRTEAEDRLARMQKYEPGITFLGYQSPAKRRLNEMHKAAAEHSLALGVAHERRELAVAAGRRARGQLAAARERLNRWQEAQAAKIDPRVAELELSGLQRRMDYLLHQLSEADIDEATMKNQISTEEAQAIRFAFRSRKKAELVR